MLCTCAKTLYPLLSTDSILEDLSQHDWKIGDSDVKIKLIGNGTKTICHHKYLCLRTDGQESLVACIHKL